MSNIVLSCHEQENLWLGVVQACQGMTVAGQVWVKNGCELDIILMWQICLWLQPLSQRIAPFCSVKDQYLEWDEVRRSNECAPCKHVPQ